MGPYNGVHAPDCPGEVPVSFRIEISRSYIGWNSSSIVWSVGAVSNAWSMVFKIHVLSLSVSYIGFIVPVFGRSVVIVVSSARSISGRPVSDCGDEVMVPGSFVKLGVRTSSWVSSMGVPSKVVVLSERD